MESTSVREIVEGDLKTFLQKCYINTKNCSAFSILVKINIDIHTELNLFEGETSVTAKMVLKKH